jgi:RNA-binding protein YhbY
MKADNKRKHHLARLLEVALNAALLIVIGYALVLLSQSQALF